MTQQHLRNSLVLAGLLWAVCGYAQEPTIKRLPGEVFRSVKKDPADTAAWRVKKAGLLNLNIAQGSLQNWAAGGDRFSLSLNAYANYYYLYKKGRYNWDNNFDFNFGFIQTTSLGSRKNDDRIDLLSKAGYRINDGERWFVSGLLNFRSQLFDGLSYSGTKGTLTSTLFAPAYITVSAGADYKPTNTLSVFISPLTARTVVIASRRLRELGLYGVPKGRGSISEMGAFVSANYRSDFFRMISYKARLDLFSNYQNKPLNVDLFMTNTVAFKINRYLSATYNLDLIYDDDIRLFGDNKNSPGLQIKSIIGIGFLARLTPVMKMNELPPVVWP